MTMIPNGPSPEGLALGEELARLTDRAEQEDRKQFPNQKPRCRTCAYRAGTVPNGCAATVMDALKCTMERIPFMCHESKNNSEFCMGWLISQGHVRDKPLPTPWDFSFMPEKVKP